MNKRNKLLVATVAGIFVGALAALAETDPKAQNILRDIRLGRDTDNQIQTLRVKDAIVLPAGSIDAADLGAGSVGSSEITDYSIATADIATGAVKAASIDSNAVTGAKLAANVVSLVDTNASTDVTLQTPTSVGQLLFGLTGGTSTIWRASALTTNSWVKVHPLP